LRAIININFATSYDCEEVNDAKVTIATSRSKVRRDRFLLHTPDVFDGYSKA